MVLGNTKLDRRQTLKLGCFAAASLILSPASAFGALPPLRTRERVLSFHNTHTGENLECCYWREGSYLSESLARIDYILRDHRCGTVKEIDLKLLDLLAEMRTRLNAKQPFHIISGYRSPETNDMLRKHSRGIAKSSLHMTGKAVDIRVPGISLARLREAALALRRGGVGYYRQSAFVHVDVGRVRKW